MPKRALLTSVLDWVELLVLLAEIAGCAIPTGALVARLAVRFLRLLVGAAAISRL